MKKNIVKVLIAFVVLVVIYLISVFFYVPKKEEVLVENIESKIEEKTDFYNISAIYVNDPFDKGKVVEKFIKQQVDQKKEEWKIGGDLYNEEQKIAKEFTDRPKMKYEFLVNYQKYSASKLGIVSYVFTVYEYTGGANGNTTVDTFTFNKDGQIAIDSVLDFANNNNDIALTRILAEKAMTDKEALFDKEMLYDGLGLSYLKADGVTLDKKKCNCDGFFFPSNFQNFIIKDEGITFIFSKYQITAGAAGTPEIYLAWKSLSPYFTAKFKYTFSSKQ